MAAHYVRWEEYIGETHAAVKRCRITDDVIQILKVISNQEYFLLELQGIVTDRLFAIHVDHISQLRFRNAGLSH